MVENLVVRTKIKQITKRFSVAEDFRDELDKVVEQLIKKACDRAKANGRHTVMARDL